jgi:hypothetical protein
MNVTRTPHKEGVSNIIDGECKQHNIHNRLRLSLFGKIQQIVSKTRLKPVHISTGK